MDADNDALYAKLGRYYLATQKWKEAEEVCQKREENVGGGVSIQSNFPGSKEGKATLEVL